MTTLMKKIREGSRTPWGTADNVTKMGADIYSVGTPSHGGIYIGAESRKTLPATVRQTFINGGSWAEEDCEMVIALVLLDAKDRIDRSTLWLPIDEMREAALQTARHFDSYHPAIPHLEKLINQPGATASS